MSSFLRTTFGLIIALLCLALSPATALRAQSFTLAESNAGFVFTSEYYSTAITRDVAILSSDQAFNASSLTITQNAPGWLVPSLSADGRTLRLTASYSGDAERTTVVTVRSATKTVSLTAQSTYVSTYRTPKTLLSADKSKLHVLYHDKVLTLNPVTRAILAQARITPPGTAALPTTGARHFSFSPNGSQLWIFYSDVPTLFRLSADTLAPLPSTTFTPAANRLFAGEKAGRLYFVRYGAITSTNSDYYTYYQSTLDVVDAATGSLLQSYDVPPLEADGLATIEDLAVHPTRPELWLRQRNRYAHYYPKMALRRLTLGENGLIDSLDAQPLKVDINYQPAASQPWNDYVARIRFAPSDPRAISAPHLFDLSIEPPTVIAPSGGAFAALADNDLASSSYSIFRLDTRENFSASTLLFGHSIFDTDTYVTGLSSDGLEFSTVFARYGAADLLPKTHFLPDLIAALPASKVRTPKHGSTVYPTSELSWYPLPGADHYRVYLSADAANLAPAEPSSEFLAGTPETASLTLDAPLAGGTTYFWRVDTIYPDRVFTGEVQRFVVSHARVGDHPLSVATVAGARRRDFTLPILTSGPDIAWQLVSDTPWLIVRSGSGVGPGTGELSIDAASLAAGVHSARLRIVTADGFISVDLMIRAEELYISAAAPLRDAARIVAIGPTSSATGAYETLLLSIDTSSEQILRCVPVPGSAVGGSDYLGINASTTTRPVYIYGYGSRIGEFDPESLALVRSYQRPIIPPRLNITPVETIRPADNGRIWVLDSLKTLSLFNPATSAYDLVFPARTETRACLSPDGGSLYTFAFNDHYAPTTATLRRLDIKGQELEPAAERVVALDPARVWYEIYPLQAHAPFRLGFQNAAYDTDLNLVADLEDPLNPNAQSTDASLFGRHLLYLGDAYSDIRVIPSSRPAERFRCYEALSRKVIVFSDLGLTFRSVDSLPLSLPLSLKADKLGDTSATLAWEQAPVLGGYPAEQAVKDLAYRVAGSGAAWSVVSSSFNAPLALSSLLPETTYEIRARVFGGDHRGALSRWSEIQSITTSAPRPAYNAATWPFNFATSEGSSVSIPLDATGKDLAWSVEGLPSGLGFNPATHTIEGVITEPGLHDISITVTNPGGSFTHVFTLSSIAKSTDLPAARYTGLLDLEGGPLAGLWSVARSGANVTGTYRSALFSRSFTAKLGPPQANSYPRFSQVRIARTSVSYQGVGIYLYVLWHLESDRLTLGAHTEDLVENFSASTTPETGLASHWAKTTRPHPDAARYTSFLYPGEGTGPDGAGFFTLDLAVDGTAKISGETALGQKFTQSIPISDAHSLPFFYFSGITLALGEMQLTRGIATGALAPRLVGELAWAFDANRKSSFYRDGFEQQLLALGAPLPATGKNLAPLTPLANDANRADFALSGGGLGRLAKPITQSLTPTATGFAAPKAGTPENPNRVSVKLDSKTGIVTGSAAILDAAGKKVVRTQSFRGMLVKDPLGDGQDVIGGYFHLPDGTGAKQSGLVEITEPQLEEAPAP